jgi:ribose-phosphate pyrophosphokinase
MNPITITSSGLNLTEKLFTFPSNIEEHIILKEKERIDVMTEITIVVQLNDMKNLFSAFLAHDVIKRINSSIKTELVITYLPYARQDRVTNINEPFSLKVMASLINSQKFDSVLIYDPHSDVSTALIERSMSVPSYSSFNWDKSFAQNVYDIANVDKNQIRLLSPDAGAYKKIYSLAQNIKYTEEIIIANKIRDTLTGQIKKTEIFEKENLNDKTIIIFDDICDGGRTFIEIAKVVKEKYPQCDLQLAVSHGIFSAGFASLGDYFSKMYTTDSFFDANKVKQKWVIPDSLYVHNLFESKLYNEN